MLVDASSAQKASLHVHNATDAQVPIVFSDNHTAIHTAMRAFIDALLQRVYADALLHALCSTTHRTAERNV